MSISHERLAVVELSASEREQQLDLIDKVFDMFIAWSAELHHHAMALGEVPTEATLRAA